MLRQNKKTFNMNLKPRREMILACLWFPLFYVDGGKLVRTQQEQEPAARALPDTEGCLPSISRSTRITEL